MTNNEPLANPSSSSLLLTALVAVGAVAALIFVDGPLLNRLARGAVVSRRAADSGRMRVVATSPPAPVPMWSCPVAGRGILQTAPHRYLVDRRAFECLWTSRLASMSLRIAPARRDGKTVGLLIAGVADGSALHYLGIHRGDLLRRINGVDLSAPERCLTAYTKVRASDIIVVEIERGGRTLQLVYQVV